MNERNQRFVNWLIGLAEKPNSRAILAELRRGLGQSPGLAPTVGRYVQPFLTMEDAGWREEAYYLIASLFGWHPASTSNGNMGDHFGLLWADDQEPPDNIARRFSILLSADRDTLPDYLRQAVGLLKSNDVPVNWAQLLEDILGWEHPEGKVQLSWSRSFWRKRRVTTDVQQKIKQNDNQEDKND